MELMTAWYLSRVHIFKVQDITEEERKAPVRDSDVFKDSEKRHWVPGSRAKFFYKLELLAFTEYGQVRALFLIHI